MYEKSRVQTGSPAFPLNRGTLFNKRIIINFFKATHRPHFLACQKQTDSPEWCFWKVRKSVLSYATLNMLFEITPWIGCFANRAFCSYLISLKNCDKQKRPQTQKLKFSSRCEGINNNTFENCCLKPRWNFSPRISAFMRSCSKRCSQKSMEVLGVSLAQVLLLSEEVEESVFSKSTFKHRWVYA